MKTHFLIPLACVAASAWAMEHPIGNVNRHLSNSARTDVIGPDMWTTIRKKSVSWF